LLLESAKEQMNWNKNSSSIRLRGLMKDTGTKQKELAQAIGVKPQTVSLYVQGQSFPDVNGLEKIARFFLVSADYLVGISETQTVDADIQAACKTTGLSEGAINALKASGGWGLDVLNCFLGNPDFFSLLLEVRRLATAERRLKAVETDLIETADDRYAKNVEELTEKRIVREYWAVEKFKELQKAVVEKLISHKEFQQMVDMVDRAGKKEFNKEETENDGKH